MLEILLIITLTKKMKEMMLNRGYDKTFGFQILAILGWIGGEVAGFFCYGFYRAMNKQEIEGFDLVGYGAAIGCAVLATAIVFFICSRFSRQSQMAYQPPPFPPR